MPARKPTARWSIRSTTAPTLVDDVLVLIQTLATIERLQERDPTPALLPSEPDARARCALSRRSSSAMSPTSTTAASSKRRGTTSVPTKRPLSECGDFCFGSAPTLADVYLVPQVENAGRLKLDIARRPNVLVIDAACDRIDAFGQAAPASHPDAS